jgi:hypothetical protein
MSRSPQSTRIRRLALTLIAALALFAAPAVAVPVNYSVAGSGDITTYDTLGGGSSTRLSLPSADVDALWVDTGFDRFVFSVAQNDVIGGVSYQDEDLILWDETTGTASLFHDFSSVFVGNEDINALHVLANGNYLISTTNTAVINGYTIEAEDIVEYNPLTFQVVQTVFDGSAIIGASEVIDGVQITPSGRFVISTTNNFSLLSGGPTYDNDDVVVYSPAGGGSLSLYLDVGALTGNNTNLNTFHVPEPRFALLFLGLLGLAVAGRPRS